MNRDQLIAAGIIKPVSPEVEEQHKKRDVVLAKINASLKRRTANRKAAIARRCEARLVQP